MLNQVKILAKLIIYYFINIILISQKDIRPNSLLLIRIDAIGDYILFRNYIEVLKNSAKYKDYKITLVGNIAWKSIAEELDSATLYLSKY